MKILITAALLSQSAIATCFMTRVLCTPNNNFQNSYELAEVTCSPPGGPANTTHTFSIYNKLNGKKPLVSKKLNITRDRFFQVKIDMNSKVPFLFIDDRSLASASNTNISTANRRSLALTNYKCKSLF